MEAPALLQPPLFTLPTGLRLAGSLVARFPLLRVLEVET